jgi:hypothetical protein
VLDARQNEVPGANDRPVFGSKFEGVTTLARHSLSQAVRRIVTDNGLAGFTPHDLRRTGATLVQAARLPVDFVKAPLNHNDKGVTGVYARWHMFEEKREAVMAIEATVLPLMPAPNAVAASHSYYADEVAAREAHAGLWQGAFIPPWDWRHRSKETVILGAAAVPVNAQTILLGAVSAAGAPDPNCVIKGNVNRKGERIYHLPGQLNYSQTSMTKGLGERWFCTEAEAEAAGWRKAAR